ncbi:glutamate racemase [Sporanaerobium hydrogeniformans]|uniref:Glutamate racemase n=1 Tax=Sporanaerobium hydrogeniformans TaxID=3072179 RepID=A0AC61DAG2_9FIRM|nr:glutamate racemase [Sporanaerobium hydrogeniformans]PHV69577.1 glutamate racemase [Sporanaerobium hydrogeniformans]
MKVGIFDSGVGGITVLKKAVEKLPGVDYIYYSDNLHVPYGTKLKEEVAGYVNEVMEFLLSKGVEVVVIACNTATSIAAHNLREKYNIPIIGMEPAVKLAVDSLNKGKILVTATSLTLKEEKYKQLISRVDQEGRVESLPLAHLVTYAEQGIFEDQIVVDYLKEMLAPYDWIQFSGIVLGCTHFVYYKDIFKKILPSYVKVFDGNEGTIQHLKEVISEKEIIDHSKKGQVTFYYSGKEAPNILESYMKKIK